MEIDRVVNSLKKISQEIELIIKDLSDDEFEEYADTLQDTLDNISILLFGLTNEG